MGFPGVSVDIEGKVGSMASPRCGELMTHTCNTQDVIFFTTSIARLLCDSFDRLRMSGSQRIFCDA